MVESPLHKVADDLVKASPWDVHAAATVVPVVGISSCSFHPLVSWIPPVGVSTVLLAELECKVGHDPGATDRFETAVRHDGHEVSPCSDELLVGAVHDVFDRFGFVVKGEP